MYSKRWIWLGLFVVTLAIGAAFWVEKQKDAEDRSKSPPEQKAPTTQSGASVGRVPSAPVPPGSRENQPPPPTLGVSPQYNPPSTYQPPVQAPDYYSPPPQGFPPPSYDSGQDSPPIEGNPPPVATTPFYGEPPQEGEEMPPPDPNIGPPPEGVYEAPPPPDMDYSQQPPPAFED